MSNILITLVFNIVDVYVVLSKVKFNIMDILIIHVTFSNAEKEKKTWMFTFQLLFL